jgi:hypothetical protein
MNYEWMELTEEEKKAFVKACNEQSVNTPQFFTLKSDRNDGGGSFREMTREDVIKAAQDAAAYLVK